MALVFDDESPVQKRLFKAAKRAIDEINQVRTISNIRKHLHKHFACFNSQFKKCFRSHQRS